jgi:rhodanese-related sulfurtransferase
MNVLQLSTLLTADRGARLLDVRTTSEFENAHIAGAYNVPLDQLHEHTDDVRHAGGPVVLICQSGQRAQRAEALLQQAGMNNVLVLDGGMNAWVARGYETRRVRPRMSLERQVRIGAGALVAAGAAGALIVSPVLAAVPLLIGGGLVFAGLTDTCAMGMLLAKLPYNRGQFACDTERIVREFVDHAGTGRS